MDWLPRSVVRIALASTLVMAGCGDDGDETADDPGNRTPGGPITVLATASLTPSFSDLAAAFEAEFEGTSVVLSFAASSELATQIDQGAPADVFASADEVTMQRLVDGVGTLGTPEVFATNTLQIIVETGNPLGITGVDDLADPDVLFVTAAPQVPIGSYTQELFERAGVDVRPRSLEDSVNGIVSKVVLGEADAGVVYVTDVLAAGDEADGVDIPDDINVVARYPIAVPADASNAATATAFVEFVLSERGREILASHGFAGP